MEERGQKENELQTVETAETLQINSIESNETPFRLVAMK